MPISRRVVALAAVAIVIVGGVIVSVATGDRDRPGGYTVLRSGPSAASSDAVERAAQGAVSDEFVLDPAAARDLGKLTPDGNWSLVPGAEGSCIVSPDGASGCAERSGFDRRGVQLIRAPNALPRLSEQELADAKAGRSPVIADKPSMDGAIYVGVAPDGVRTVRLSDEQGEVARAAVKNNAYVFTEVARDPSLMELLAEDGSVVTSVPVG